jgi:hypothetical protein
MFAPCGAFLGNYGLCLRGSIFMPYQYKREPLSDDEVNWLTIACVTIEEKFIIWILLDTGLP